MHKYYLLKLKCGGLFETVAQAACPCCNRDYEHNYVGKEMSVRCCDGDHTVVEQKEVLKLLGLRGNEPHPKE